MWYRTCVLIFYHTLLMSALLMSTLMMNALLINALLIYLVNAFFEPLCRTKSIHICLMCSSLGNKYKWSMKHLSFLQLFRLLLAVHLGTAHDMLISKQSTSTKETSVQLSTLSSPISPGLFTFCWTLSIADIASRKNMTIPLEHSKMFILNHGDH